MRCVEDQIKDNMGPGQGLSELRWMGREEGDGRESGGGGGRRKKARGSVCEVRKMKKSKRAGQEEKESAGGEVEWWSEEARGQEGREGRMVEVEGRTTLWG